MKKALMNLTAAAVMCFALSGCGGAKVADKYEDSLTKAFLEKMEGEKLSLEITIVIDYENEKIDDDSDSQLLEVNGENKHYILSLESGDIEYYKIDGKTWRVDAEKKEIHPLENSDFLNKDNADIILADLPESDDFVSAEKEADGNIREIFDVDGVEKVFTYDKSSGMLIEQKYETDKIPGDNKAVITMTVKNFEEDCGEIKLPDGYTMIE